MFVILKFPGKEHQAYNKYEVFLNEEEKSEDNLFLMSMIFLF